MGDTATGERLSEAYGEAAVFDKSFWQLFSSTARVCPDRLALVSAHQPCDHIEDIFPSPTRGRVDQRCSIWTYGRLLQAAESLSALLSSVGFQPGDIVVVMLLNSVEWAVVCWSCARLGITFAPLDPRLAERQREFRHVLETLKPRGIIVADRAASELLNQSCSDLLFRPEVILRATWTNESVTEGWSSVEQALRCRTASDLGTEQSSGKPELILFTSGTTSLSKACPFYGHQLQAATDVSGRLQCIAPQDRVLILGPMFYMQSIWLLVMAWRTGASVFVPAPRFKPAAALRCLKQWQCTHMGSTPTTILSLLSHPDVSPDGYPHLKLLRLGGDLVAQQFFSRCEKELTADKTFVGGGMTECMGILRVAMTDPVTFRDGIPTIGRVGLGCAVKVCNEGSTMPIPLGKIGELHMSGPSVILGYMKDNHLIQDESFYSDQGRAWFKTGDMAFMDENDAVYMKGRYKDMIIRGGENISPLAMEATLDTIDGVKVCSQVCTSLHRLLTFRSHKSSESATRSLANCPWPSCMLRGQSFHQTPFRALLNKKCCSTSASRIG